MIWYNITYCGEEINMRILLISITPLHTRISTKRKTKKKLSTFPPLGILYIGSSLEQNGHKVDIIDFHSENNPISSIKQLLPIIDVVGIGVYTASISEVKKISRFIKKFNKDMPIIIGGPHCIFYPNKALIDIPNADISVDCEGEQVINKIIEEIQGKKEFSRLNGIHYRKNNIIKKGKKIHINCKLDKFDFPARHLVEKYVYGKVGKYFFYKPKFTTILTSRGCPFKCRFCTRHISSMKEYRLRTAKNVINEFIEINQRYNSVMIVDDNFLADKKRTHIIMDGLIDNNIELEIYIQGARVDSADRTLYKKLKKAGVKHLYFGLETGNQDVLNYYNKGITIDQIRKAINLSKEMNFLTLGNFIIGAPIETKKHIIKTVDFACSLPLDVAIFNPLSFQRGSDLWNEAVENGNIVEGVETLADIRLGLGNFTSDELEEFCKDATKKFYLRPKYISSQIIKSIIEKDLNYIKVGLNNI
jgi:radical SAM superfamily enzyme YgiQ (UPF0313 family)